MSAPALLAETAGLTLRAEDDRLHWRADTPPDSNLLARLRWHKADLLELLTDIDERAGILEFDGGIPREQAETKALPKCWPRRDWGGTMTTPVRDRPSWAHQPTSTAPDRRTP